jgi:hypothetical protein
MIPVHLQCVITAVACIMSVSCASDPSGANITSREPAVALAEQFQLTPANGRLGGLVDPIARHLDGGPLLVADQGRSTPHVFSPHEIVPPFHMALSHDTVVMISMAMGARQVCWLRLSCDELGVLQDAELLTDSSFARLPRMQHSTMLWFAWPNGPMPSAMTPQSVRLQFVGSTLVLGVWTDDSGLVYVRAFANPLER